MHVIVALKHNHNSNFKSKNIIIKFGGDYCLEVNIQVEHKFFKNRRATSYIFIAKKKKCSISKIKYNIHVTNDQILVILEALF